MRLLLLLLLVVVMLVKLEQLMPRSCTTAGRLLHVLAACRPAALWQPSPTPRAPTTKAHRNNCSQAGNLEADQAMASCWSGQCRPAVTGADPPPGARWEVGPPPRLLAGRVWFVTATPPCREGSGNGLRATRCLPGGPGSVCTHR